MADWEDSVIDVMKIDGVKLTVYYTDPSATPSNKYIEFTEDDIISMTVSDKTYVYGEFTENGNLTVTIRAANIEGTYTKLYGALKNCNNVFMRMTHNNMVIADNNIYDKRYFLTDIQYNVSSSDAKNYNKARIDSITLTGVDCLGILTDETVSVSKIGDNTLADIVTFLNEKIKNINGANNNPKYNIQIKVTNSVYAFINDYLEVKSTAINITDMAIRDIIRCIAEAYMCVVYCRGGTIYIDKYGYVDDHNDIYANNVVADSVSIENTGTYTGFSIDYVTETGVTGTSTFGNQTNAKSITGNPFICGDSHAFFIYLYQSEAYPENAVSEIASFEIIKLYSYYDFTTQNKSSEYDKMAVVVGILPKITNDARYYVITSREYVFDENNISYNISCMPVNYRFYQNI